MMEETDQVEAVISSQSKLPQNLENHNVSAFTALNPLTKPDSAVSSGEDHASAADLFPPSAVQSEPLINIPTSMDGTDTFSKVIPVPQGSTYAPYNPYTMSSVASSQTGGSAPPVQAPVSTQWLQPQNAGLVVTAFSPVHPSAALAPSIGPPPRSGFQPIQQTKVTATAQPPPTYGAVPKQMDVHMFTPQFDPSAPPSPYTAPPTSTVPAAGVSQYTDVAQYTLTPSPPGMLQTPHEASAAISLSLDPMGDSPYSSPRTEQGGLFDWFKNNETVHNLMQKAKSGVESVITAMDPQMKTVLHSGGDINIVVASAKDVKVQPVREAFQAVFGRATVNGQDSQPGIAPQPVGYAAGIKGAEERIESLRRHGLVHQDQPVVAVESFIVDLQPDRWYDMSVLLLRDPSCNIELQTFSQATPVDVYYVQQAQQQTPQNYSLLWSGLAVSVGEVMNNQYGIDKSDWQGVMAGVSRMETIFLAAKQLAYLYKQALPRQR